MYDILTAAAIVDELSDTLPEGRIQRAGLRDPQTVALEIYRDRRRQHLIATIGDPEPALFRSADPFAIDPGLVTPFALLLRKYVRGATLIAIDQPPLERIVRLSIAKRFWPHNRADDQDDQDDQDDDDGEGVQNDFTLPELTFVYLYIELMGRRSNVILVDEAGFVMDSLKRVTPRMSRVRPIWPSARFSMPPARSGIDPRSATAGQVARLLQAAAGETPLQKVLIETVRGLSPAMAGEVVWRTSGSVDAPVVGTQLDQLAAALRAIVKPLETATWEPCLYRNSAGDLAAYSAIPFESLRVGATEERSESMSEAVAAWQRTVLHIAGRHDGRRNRLLGRIQERRASVSGRLRSVEKQQASVAEAERLRRWGEAIYAHLWEIAPSQPALAVEGETIPLDPLRPPKEVAAGYFERYRRMQRGAGEVERQLEEIRVELDYLDQLETMARLAESFQEIENMLAEWEVYLGPARGEAEGKRRSQPDRMRPFTDQEGNQIYVGRTGPQNDRVTFEIAGPDDWWLHARGVPGSHVVVRGNGRDPSDGALEKAAALAAWYSKNRTSGKVEVDIARRRDVRKIKGAGPGMVTYRNERTILVSPAPESGG